MELYIKNEDFNRLENLHREIPRIADILMKEALKKVINYVKNKNKDKIKDLYTADEEIIKGDRNIRTKANAFEAIMEANTKKNKLDNFKLSVQKPRKTKNHIFTEIQKGKNSKWKTLFWGYYKQGNPKLIIRNGRERYKITTVRTLSTKSMAQKGLQQMEFDEIQEIFSDVIRKGLESYGY